jgi:DNA-binding response OmpR family regulator
MNDCARPRILIVEDEILIALELENTLRGAGYVVVGPARSVEDALKLLGAHAVDGALLDVTLRDGRVFPVADALSRAGVAFLFVTGHDPNAFPPAHRQAPTIGKPYEPQMLLSRLAGLLAERANRR